MVEMEMEMEMEGVRVRFCMKFSDDRAQTKEGIHVMERLCRPAHVFQTATEPSTSGSTAITMASD